MINKLRDKALDSLSENINAFVNIDSLDDVTDYMKAVDRLEKDRSEQLDMFKSLYERDITKLKRDLQKERSKVETYEYWLYPKLKKEDVARVCAHADKSIALAEEALGRKSHIAIHNKVIYKLLKRI